MSGTQVELINPIIRRIVAEVETTPESFWARQARRLHWFRTWDTVFEWNYPERYRWFIGGETNLSYNALDRHVERGWGGHTALVYANERGERRLFTYAQLHREVERLAAALRGLGVQKGDRITIYMPVCPEAITLMLAAVRVGAIHIVVFAGFGARALADRIEASGSRFLFAADVTYRKGSTIPLKGIVDQALEQAGHSVERVVLLRRGDEPVPMTAGRDLTWEEFVALADGQSGAVVPLEANEPAFIMATSGTTARPKLTVHTHGGYAVWIMSTGDWLFRLRPSDVWWATSDIGWIVGHSYIVYAPLMVGCTSIAYEGAIDHPGPETFWQLVEEFNITGIFTAPTAVRLLMRYGTEPAHRFDLSSLRRIVCAGEPLNPPAWHWLQKEVFRDRIPVIDHWWQTETGGPVIGNPYGLCMVPIKPGSATLPMPGVHVDVVTLEGDSCGPNEKGILVLTGPFPGLTSTLWGEHDRYLRDYWERIPGRRLYFTGDAAHVDEDGYIWFAGRADEVVNVAGHRIGTVEVETALLTHPAVAEAGVTGRPDEVKGEVLSAFVVLRPGHEPSEALKQELVQTVRRELGPVAVVGELTFVSMLPKTRSGKIMRRVLKAVILDKDPGDITTIEEEGSVDEARAAWEQLRAERQDE
ncbi:MAG: acetate--CoA ligase [Ardenticatenia bacterium]|nr:acetate--CoA ligase [Ardenticatenia bacterium]